MSGRVGHRKRLVCVTAGNLRQNHLNLTGHTDFFPADCYGAATKNGKPRRFFRERAWAREFFAKHGLKPGDTVAIERIGSHHFRITPCDTKQARDCPATFRFDAEPEGDGPRVIRLPTHACAAARRAL